MFFLTGADSQLSLGVGTLKKKVKGGGKAQGKCVLSTWGLGCAHNSVGGSSSGGVPEIPGWSVPSCFLGQIMGRYFSSVLFAYFLSLPLVTAVFLQREQLVSPAVALKDT